uniref:Tetratricopeptide repeat protein n=1 Tax=candidate division WOR-3 bacterium TaxID=2052148 RepID=A0A7V1EI81_UNCW3
MNCPRCGYNNPETANFCSCCGLQLIKTTGQRRPVAVIFADISGFTSLAEKMDPEEVKDLIDQCLQRLAQVIQKYEGFVDKFIGDCVMALFGAPIAHEDDPLRAVLAGIDLLKEIKAFNAEKKQNLSLSIGINYGLVATGDLGRPGGYTVMGDTVNIAQRLQVAAPRGKIYVSEEIYKYTNREIIYKRLKKISVKGKKDRIPVYAPLRARLKYGQRKIEEIPLIGRVEEMNFLNKIFEEINSGMGRVVAIVGEAGIGKTKLVYEFKKRLGKNAFITEGKGIEYHINSPYFVLKEVLKRVFGINDDDTPAMITRRIIRFIENTDDAILKVKLPYYKYFLSADLTKSERAQLESMQGEDRSRLLLEAIHALFLKFSRFKPLVMIFDDCHWIDKETIEFIHTITGSIGYKPVMLITLYRPSFDIGNISQLPYFSSITLKPLRIDETTALLKKILHCDKIDRDLFTLLLKKSGAVPFYISELALNLVNNDMIHIKDGVAKLKGDLTISIPRSLDELIMTKIDKLSTELRDIVNIASVIGEEFSFKLLNALIPGKERLRQNLAYIVQQNIFKITELKDSSEDEKYAFTHSIIRDAIYNSLLKKQQREYHQKVGFIMEKIFNLTIEEYFDALAHHFYLGGETTKALEYMERAGDQKKELYLNNSAIELYKKCLTMVPEGMPQISIRIFEKLGTIYELIGDYENALVSYSNMESYAGKDPVVKARSLRHRANIIANQGDFDKGLGLLTKAYEYLKSFKERLSVSVLVEVSNIRNLECWLYRIKGRMEIAESKGLEAIKIITRIKDWKFNTELKQALTRAYNNLSVIYCVKGDFEKALQICKEALNVAEDTGDLRGKVNAYNVMGTVFKALGDYEKAIDSFTMNLKITEELGDKRGIGMSYCNLGNVYQHKGDNSTALDLYQKFLEISQELRDKSGIGMASNNMGIIYFNMGNYEKALKFFENYLNICKELGDKRGIAIAYGNMGEVLMNRFEYDRAVALFKKFLKISQEIGDKRGIASASYNLGYAYTEIARLKLAYKYSNEARKFFESIGNKNALGMVLNTIALIKLKENEPEEALKLLDSSFSFAETTHSDELKIQCLFTKARVYAQIDKERAKENFNAAIELCQKSKVKKLLADIYYEYALFLNRMNEKQMAKRYKNLAAQYYSEINIKRK